MRPFLHHLSITKGITPVRITKTLAIASVGAMLALTAACGSSGNNDNADNGDTNDNGGAPAPANIRLWLNGSDTPDDVRAYLKQTFEAQNPGSTLTIEQQDWTGLVDKLQTALPSSDTPDVVEVGNTQAPTFTTVGAFTDVTDDLAGWGGSDLLPGFVDGATVDGHTYAVPYYAGSTYVFYRKDLFKKAGITEVPTTLDEFVADAIKLKQANPTPADFSGYWLPGKDWRDGAAFLWAAGGDFAVPDGDGWKGDLESSESQTGLAMVQKIFQQASGAPADSDENDPVTPFCAGKIGMMSRPGWVMGSLNDAKTGCPDLAKQVGVFALPGNDGKTAPVLLGGSDIGISAKSPNQELAKNLVGIILSDEYQTMMASHGLTPAKVSLASKLGTDQFAQATIAAASNAKLTPGAANWATVESDLILEDFFSQIASGGDLASLSKSADEKITADLN
jgi:N,N'-diacetylchitobiose transport system substrate-binding protein